jgi:hypothetical protein
MAVTTSHVDTFQSGTTLNWSGNSSPTNIATGGPAGAGDRFLQISANNSAAGIQAVEVDMNHFAGGPVSIRLFVFGPGGTFASATTQPIATGAWNHYYFGLMAADLTNVDGGGDLAATLADVNRLLIRHDPAPTPTPPGASTSLLTATLGIDNIRAVPEPGAVVLALLGGALLLARRRWNGGKQATGTRGVGGRSQDGGRTDRT